MSHYGTSGGADAYHSARGNTSWAALTEAQKTAALVRGSDYVDQKYRAQFSGTKTGGRTQEREWPRTGATDASCQPIPDDDVPDEIIRAAYEAALRESQSAGSLSPDFVASQFVTKEKVDVIEVTYSDKLLSAEGATPNRPVVPVIDEILAGLLKPIRTGIGVFVV